VRVPEGIDGKDVQRQLLAERGLEVGGGLGAATPPIWRVGLMGPNASEETADEVLGALTAVLEGERVPVAG
jgi:alanine-glyoxylate transaminase / serine-glyoxylate transaminase / serine-pyruvate transaminase